MSREREKGEGDEFFFSEKKCGGIKTIFLYSFSFISLLVELAVVLLRAASSIGDRERPHQACDQLHRSESSLRGHGWRR